MYRYMYALVTQGIVSPIVGMASKQKWRLNMQVLAFKHRYFSWW